MKHSPERYAIKMHIWDTPISGAGQENTKAPRHCSLRGEFPAQMASNLENVSIWWRHHDGLSCVSFSSNSLYVERIRDWFARIAPYPLS